jgi:hypothetical protein
MTGARADHPVHAILADSRPFVVEVAQALGQLLETVERAAPARWMSKRRDFRALTTERKLFEMRSELVVAAMLACAEVPFDFGDPHLPNPDLVLKSGFGIEITAKNPDGLEMLYEELDDGLSKCPGASVTLWFSDYPIRLERSARADLVREVLVIAARVGTSREGGIVERTVADPRNGSDVVIQAVVHPVPRLMDGLRVTWQTDSGPLGPSLAAVERDVLGVLQDEKKRRQAESMPTVLAVDISRLGPGWMRPSKVWAQQLASSIPSTCPFVGVAVFTSSLDRVGCDMALAVAPSTPSAERSMIDDLAKALCLEPL